MASQSSAESTASHRVFVALGSNVGDRMRHFEEAALRLALVFEPRTLRSSPVYETAPIGPVGSTPFLNAVIEGMTDMAPEELLHHLQQVEIGLGRQMPREGPRTIDLDILFYDDLVMDVPGLTIPHPRLHERAFVLKPMSDLDPTFRHPCLSRTVGDLLAGLDVDAGIMGVAAPSIAMTQD